MKIPLIVLTLLAHSFTFTAVAQEPAKHASERKESVVDKVSDNLKSAAEKTEAVISDINETLNTSRSLRAGDDYLVMLNYSYLDLILPGKYGFTLGMIQGANTTWELEYLTGSMAIGVDDIGSMHDKRISLMKRSFGERNSFNFFYGLNYFSFEGGLNEDLLASVAPSLRNQARQVRVESLGLNWGIGNRWTFHKYNKNFTISVDWLNWSQPLIELRREAAFLDYSTNPNYRSTVKTVVDVFSYLPRFNALKIQLGMSF